LVDIEGIVIRIGNPEGSSNYFWTPTVNDISDPGHRRVYNTIVNFVWNKRISGVGISELE
jgi:hypothetical protein